MRYSRPLLELSRLKSGSTSERISVGDWDSERSLYFLSTNMSLAQPDPERRFLEKRLSELPN